MVRFVRRMSIGTAVAVALALLALVGGAPDGGPLSTSWAAGPAPAGAAAGAGQGGEAAVAATAPAPTHRPLRSNVEPGPPNPTEPSRFTGYPGAPAFTVVPRKDQIALYPCTTCHKVLPLNTTPRKLVAAPHVGDLPHGKGRMWCLNCHQAKDRDQLVSVTGQPVDFDRADQVCGQCHGDRHRDWHFGGHGKRAEGWRGDRQLYACTHCHDAHNPALQPRAPGPPPPVRAGLMSRLPPVHAPPTAETKP